MSNKIDVLRVMKDAYYALSEESDSDDMGNARAAVAELIEADQEFDAANQAHSEIIETEGYRCEDETIAFNRLTEAKQRRRAALARVGVDFGK